MNIDLSGITGLQEPEKKEFELIPEGEKLLMQVEGVELKTTKSGDGQRLEVCFVCVDPDSKYVKRKVWQSFNVVNKNPVAVDIAKKQLKQLSDACEIVGDNLDIYDLVGRSCSCTISVRAPFGIYGASNEIKKYSRWDGLPF